MSDFPVLVKFVPGTRLFREPENVPQLPIVQNGPPGTFVIFADGTRVPLPTDQIVFADDTGGDVLVGFGGMKFEGIEDGQLVLYRVHDLLSDERLSPQRGLRMTLEPHMVSTIQVDGRVLWPLASTIPN